MWRESGELLFFCSVAAVVVGSLSATDLTSQVSSLVDVDYI
jgi:hypothetical protein